MRQRQAPWGPLFPYALSTANNRRNLSSREQISGSSPQIKIVCAPRVQSSASGRETAETKKCNGA
jgi:hypothetical protein